VVLVLNHFEKVNFDSLLIVSDGRRSFVECFLPSEFTDLGFEEAIFYYFGNDFAKISYSPAFGYKVLIDSCLREFNSLWKDCVDYIFSPPKIFWRMVSSGCSDEMVIKKREEIVINHSGLLPYVDNILRNTRPWILSE
jgi:hypothetical protein